MEKELLDKKEREAKAITEANNSSFKKKSGQSSEVQP